VAPRTGSGQRDPVSSLGRGGPPAGPHPPGLALWLGPGAWVLPRRPYWTTGDHHCSSNRRRGAGGRPGSERGALKKGGPSGHMQTKHRFEHRQMASAPASGWAISHWPGPATGGPVLFWTPSRGTFVLSRVGLSLWDPGLDCPRFLIRRSRELALTNIIVSNKNETNCPRNRRHRPRASNVPLVRVEVLRDVARTCAAKRAKHLRRTGARTRAPRDELTQLPGGECNRAPRNESNGQHLHRGCARVCGQTLRRRSPWPGGLI